MTAPLPSGLCDFAAVAASLHRGDFSALEPLFDPPPTPAAPLAAWLLEGRFASDRPALNEALACACFNGRTAWVAYLLDHGADLVAGAGTGMNGFHWAANRGQLETVEFLLSRHAPMEVRNAYGGTVLGCTVWATMHEPRPGQRAVMARLLEAGADVKEAEYPTGDREIDEFLERHGARA